MNHIEFARLPKASYTEQEVMNTLCTNLSLYGSNMKKIMYTSSRSSEGKTFMILNTLRTMASFGKRVVLVDCDLRRSIINGRYGVKITQGEGLGLTHYLAGRAEEEDILYSTNIGGAYIVPIGREVSHSLQMLTTQRFAQLINHLAESFDMVLLDTAPIGVIVDAAEVAKCCDGAVMVVTYNQTTRRELFECKTMIQRSGCAVVGAIINNVDFDAYSSKKYYQKYYYSSYSKEKYLSNEKR